MKLLTEKNAAQVTRLSAAVEVEAARVMEEVTEVTDVGEGLPEEDTEDRVRSAQRCPSSPAETFPRRNPCSSAPTYPNNSAARLPSKYRRRSAARFPSRTASRSLSRLPNRFPSRVASRCPRSNALRSPCRPPNRCPSKCPRRFAVEVVVAMEAPEVVVEDMVEAMVIMVNMEAMSKVTCSQTNYVLFTCMI